MIFFWWFDSSNKAGATAFEAASRACDPRLVRALPRHYLLSVILWSAGPPSRAFQVAPSVEYALRAHGRQLTAQLRGPTIYIWSFWSACPASAIRHSPNSIFEMPYASRSSASGLIRRLPWPFWASDDHSQNPEVAVKEPGNEQQVKCRLVSHHGVKFVIQMSKKRRELPTLLSFRARWNVAQIILTTCCQLKTPGPDRRRLLPASVRSRKRETDSWNKI